MLLAMERRPSNSVENRSNNSCNTLGKVNITTKFKPYLYNQLVRIEKNFRHWLYGEIEGGSELIDAKKKKGWFPVKCVRLNERLKYVESEEIEAEGDSYRQAQDSIHENDQTSQNEQKLKNKKEN
jgi:hypothetical protein